MNLHAGELSRLTKWESFRNDVNIDEFTELSIKLTRYYRIVKV